MARLLSGIFFFEFGVGWLGWMGYEDLKIFDVVGGGGEGIYSGVPTVICEG